jgi:hypothetical protein
MFIYEIDLVSPHFSRSSPQVSDDETSTETRQEGDNAQDLSEKIMAPWTFSIKFSYGTQFTFGSLIFVVEEDGNLELLTQGPPPKHSTLVYGQAPYLSANSSTSGGAYSSLNPYAEPYHRAIKTTQVMGVRLAKDLCIR